MKAPRTLGLIPARGGSKGLPGKNLRPLAGLPLLAHTIACARRCRELARVVVSTDCDEIAAAALAHGAEVPFRRPAELAADDTPMWPVVQHALRAVEAAEGVRYDAVVLLEPTTPGRLPEDVSGALATLAADDGCDGVVGVSVPDFNPLWVCMVEEGGYLRSLVPEAGGYARRQDLPTVYRINGMVYAWRRDFVLSSPDWRAGRLRAHQVPECRALDIDTAEQLAEAEDRLASGRLNLPWLEGA